MTRSSALFGVVFAIVGIFGAPVLLTIAWIRRFRHAVVVVPRWRGLLRDVVLAGATIEFVAFWIFYFKAISIAGADELAGFLFYDKWMPVPLWSCIFLILIGFLGKGKGRFLAIASCAIVILDLYALSGLK
jgi:hypothetical protein